MRTLLQFSGVTCDTIAGLSFALAAGETAIVKADDKPTVMELALGDRMPSAGSIQLHGKPLAASMPGTIGWVASSGGLINNLKVWENVTLPLWYHGKRVPADTEYTVQHWLKVLGMDSGNWTDFMALQPARLEPWECKLAGLLRGLVQAPTLLVVDAALFDDVDGTRSSLWAGALKTFAGESGDRAVLVVADKATLLPWRTIG